VAQILVRDIEDDVKERLRRRAARHGRSMEAEVRDILRDALKDERQVSSGLGTRIAARFRGIGLRKGEEIPELRGFTVKSPFEE
jgi:plasmid stability protein